MPLIGALRSGPEQIQGMAADALGGIGGKAAELALWGPAFSPECPEPFGSSRCGRWRKSSRATRRASIA